MAQTAHEKLFGYYYMAQGLRSRAAGRRPLRLLKEEWTFSRKAEKKHKWRNWRLENAKRSIYSTTAQDRNIETIMIMSLLLSSIRPVHDGHVGGLAWHILPPLR